MKLFHNIRLTVFVNPGEDEQAVVKGLLSLIPFNIEQEKIELKRQNAQGFQEKNIVIFELLLQKESHTTKLWRHLMEHLGEDQKEKLKRQIESRLDTECNFFIRLDKQKLQEGIYEITDSGSCYHLRFSVACFPKTRQGATACLNKLIK